MFHPPASPSKGCHACTQTQKMVLCPLTQHPHPPPHRALLIRVRCLNQIWRIKTDWLCFALNQAPSIPKRNTCNHPHCTEKRGGGGGRVTLTYRLIFLPRVPKSPWRSSRTRDLQTDMMHGCKNGRAYAQSPAEQSEVSGTIF